MFMPELQKFSYLKQKAVQKEFDLAIYFQFQQSFAFQKILRLILNI